MHSPAFVRPWLVVVIAFLLLIQAHGGAQTLGLIQGVRAAVARQDFAEGEKQLAAYRTQRGVTPEWLEALSWMGRGALAARQYARAEQFARQTHELALAALRSRPLDQEPRLPIALGAAIEVQGHALAETGARSEAVAFLEGELATYRTTSIAKRIQKNLNLLSLTGTAAPALDRSEGLGPRTLSLADVKGKVTVLFFWAHWCPDCKSQAPLLASLLDKYQARGFTVVAPTQRYGYVAGGRDAAPDEEKAYIESVRQTYYPFLPQEAVQLAEANHLRYGVSTTPTLVVLDRAGIVRAYHPGNMTAQELEPLIERYLQR